MRILISGGPGSGCTSTALALGQLLGIPCFDSDAYFHKPTDPPFQEQYTPGERRKLLNEALAAAPAWILGGSVADWECDPLYPTHGVFLQIPQRERLRRIAIRQKKQFGSRIDPGGDLFEEHESFLQWASQYEQRTGAGRNLAADRTFLEMHCGHFLLLAENEPLPRIVDRIADFLKLAKPT